jgi:D-glycerate 3-kinase
LALWPSGTLTAAEFASGWTAIGSAFLERLRQHRIPEERALDLAGIYLPLGAWTHRQKQGQETLVLGINGAQGSGKSTLCDFLRLLLEQLYGWRAVGLSIDDFYQTIAERERLSRELHPLFVTRGVPGTHDVDLCLSVLRRLRHADPADHSALPAFDKARDDRLPESEWPRFVGRPDCVILEGWCVGTPPQPDQALTVAANELEAHEDSSGIWRKQVNNELRGRYRELFGELDRLVMLRVPGMESVFAFRELQEQKLAASRGAEGRHKIMDTAALRRFIMHYERLTLHNLETLPGVADVALYLDGRQRFVGAQINR